MSFRPSPKREWDLTEEAFSRFLVWLHPDPDQAGQKYEDVRRRLIKIFTCRGCTCSEDLADETINRVIRKVPEIAATYVGDPALYFYGVAHKIHLEYLRRKPDPQPPPKVDDQSRAEEELACLEKCMELLPSHNRDLVLAYYQEEKHLKIDLRKRMAERLGIPLNALRIRAHRIRMNLQECVFECLQQKAAA